MDTESRSSDPHKYVALTWAAAMGARVKMPKLSVLILHRQSILHHEFLLWAAPDSKLQLLDRSSSC